MPNTFNGDRIPRTEKTKASNLMGLFLKRPWAVK